MSRARRANRSLAQRGWLARIGAYPGLASRPIRFIVVFACCFLLGVGLLVTPSVQTADVQFSRALVKTSWALLHACGAHVRVEGPILYSTLNGFAVEMRDGCNAVNVTILLWSAVLAYPAPWKLRAAGLLAGTLILQALNLVRFISLFYLGQYSLTWFEFAHGYLWESLLVLDTVVMFWLWVNLVSRSGKVPDVAH